MSELKSLANSDKFPKGQGVAINKKMYVWDDGLSKRNRFVTCWTGNVFIAQNKVDSSELMTWQNACEIPTQKTRPMTHVEILKLKDVVFKYYNNYCHFWNTDFIIESHQYCHKDDLVEPIENSPWKKLEVECE